MKKFLIIILYVSTTLFSQNTNGIITGNVVDAVTKSPIIGANVLVVGTDFGAATDINGKFTISNLPSNTYQIRVSSIGYTIVTKTDIVVNPNRPAQIDIQLTSTVIELESVTVTSDYFSTDPIEVNSVRNFSYEEIRRTPGGFEDVIRALSVLPGVAQAEAGRNDLIVRGGAPSENLYIIDGIEVSNINHFGTQGASGGPLSYINLDFVKETSFSTGGFSSRYGDKLSSVLSIDLREGRNDRLGGKATISASQFGLNIEGPLSNNSNFLISARRSYLDFIFKAAGFGFVPEYYDVISKYNIKLGKGNLSYLFVGAFDNIRYFNDTEDQRFNNSRILGSEQVQYVTGLTYTGLFNKGFYKFILSRNFVDFDTSQRDSLLNPIFLSKAIEGENSLRAEIVYKLSSVYELNLGSSIKNIKAANNVLFPFFKTTFGDTLNITSLNSENRFTKAAAYINLNIRPINNLFINLGGRLDYFDAIESKYAFSPRFSTSYAFDELTSVSFSTGIYKQTPSYIWLQAVPGNNKLKFVGVNQYVAGFDRRLQEDLMAKVEFFIKDYYDYPASELRNYLVLANTGAGYAGSDDNFSSFGLEPLISGGKGFSKGIEFSLQKKLSEIPLYGIFSLTYSETKFTALDGIEREGAYNQKWLLSFSGGYKFNEKWEASLKFRYATGRPYTPFNSDGSQNVSDYNTLRLEPIHSLDLRVDRRWNFAGWTLITYIDIQNVYNQKNRNFVRWDARKQKIAENESIGLLPSIGISAEF